jgi:hypothetical protein
MELAGALKARCKLTRVSYTFMLTDLMLGREIWKWLYDYLRLQVLFMNIYHNFDLLRRA